MIKKKYEAEILTEQFPHSDKHSVHLLDRIVKDNTITYMFFCEGCLKLFGITLKTEVPKEG